MTDPQVRRVPWRDLVSVSRLETIRELLISLPWLAGSLWCASRAHLNPVWFLAALPLSFVFFLAALRQVHNGYHNAIGISRRATNWFLLLMSGVMLGSLHAIKFNHLQHHRHCLDEHDVEGSSATMSAVGALCYGPLFTVRLHCNALKNAPEHYQLWVRSEIAISVAIVLAALTTGIPWLQYHATVMLFAHCLTAFFAVWTVHHDCDRSHLIARTVRGRMQAWLTFEMFYHVEHHLFPAVPTCHLPALAARLDRAEPELQTARVLPAAIDPPAAVLSD